MAQDERNRFFVDLNVADMSTLKHISRQESERLDARVAVSTLIRRAIREYIERRQA